MLEQKNIFEFSLEFNEFPNGYDNFVSILSENSNIPIDKFIGFSAKAPCGIGKNSTLIFEANLDQAKKIHSFLFNSNQDTVPSFNGYCSFEEKTFQFRKFNSNEDNLRLLTHEELQHYYENPHKIITLTL